MDALPPLLPEALSVIDAAVLIAVSFLTSAIAITFGLGGGVVMLAVMATVLPPLAVIPIHAVVQLGSNAGRAVIMRRQVIVRITAIVVVGSLIGAAIASQLVIALPIPTLSLILACFILWTVWGPKMGKRDSGDIGYFLVGVGATFATMFVGATGPLMATVLSPDKLGKEGTVSTHAACMTFQHGLKIVAFGLLGFAFLEWVPLVAAMIASGFIGTLMGRRILERLWPTFLPSASRVS